MGRKKSQKKNVLAQTGQVASVVLEALAVSSVVFPPLQSAASGALYIATLVKNFRADTKQWAEFSDYVKKRVQDAIGNLPHSAELREDIRDSIRQLSSTLERIGKDIEGIQEKSTTSRFLASASKSDQRDGMKRHLDEAIKLLTLKMTITTGMDVATLVENQSRNAIVERRNQTLTSKRLERCMEMIGSTITSSSLPYTTTAGWDDTKVCLTGTRRALIDRIMHWVHTPNLHGTEQIFLLVDVVGSGKTALAHTVAEMMVFWPPHFSLIALPVEAVLALSADPNLLLSQPVPRLFKTLVFEPLIQSDVDGPVAIVIDALDEAESGELQNILRAQIPKLPGIFRVFVTSRPKGPIIRSLAPDIVPVDLGIHGSANHEDVATYIDYRLNEIASYHGLEDWPNPQLIANLVTRGEGLFIWIATICDYLLSQVCYPDKMLERLLEGMRDTQLPPEKKMDSLYSTILEACHWDDIDFVEGYQQVMGVLMVQKMPLTVDALQLLHGAMPRVKAILLPMASLVTGVTSSIQPAQILHSSLREYITVRAIGRHFIHPELPHAHLAHLCLDMVNRLFSTAISGCGYLGVKKEVGIPDIEVDHFTDEQWYALEFWSDHLTRVEKLAPDVIEALETFLSGHLATWIEILVSKRLYRSLIPTRKWLQTTSATRHRLVGYITNKDLSRSLRRLPKRLTQDARQREALDVIEDLKDMKQNRRRKPRPIVRPKPVRKPLAITNGDGSDDSWAPQLQSVSNSSDDDELDSDSDESDSDSDESDSDL
ncbi:hypothetical protein B0H19DRAFT_1386322 [Mycena capillaripes]|nr:hypothetical protein B0H19DRAFT_1386322 [Mycena capillaripes]